MKNQNIIDKPLLMPETLKNELFFGLFGVKMAGLENANFCLNPSRYQFQCFLMMCGGGKDASIEGWMPSVAVGVAEICALLLCR